MTEPMDAEVGPVVRPATPRWLVVVVAVLAAVFVAVLFFVLGRQLPWFDGSQSVVSASAPASSTADATPLPTSTPTTAPEPVAAPPGPVAAGLHPWSELRGGECLDPFGSPWDEAFTVVDCAAPHAAQLISRVSLNSDPAAGYPGEAAITAQLNLACTSPTVLDFGAAAAYPDVQWQASYPVSEAQWAAGQREYSCFITRSSGEQLTGSLQTQPGA